ncbi:MAG: response regulator [Bacteroidales bacterium]|nr:response regulator [Bacteroidales bacterium]
MERIKGTVLISDRNKGLLTALVLLLQKVFSRVITEAEPARILEMAATGDIDVVVLDTGQNGGSGQQEHTKLVRDLAALEQNVQVVALTNFGQSQFAMELADEGAFDFVPKPWNNEKLLVTLRNAWRMRQLENALRQVEMTAGNMESEEEKDEKSSGREKGNERILTLEQMEKKMMKAAIKRNRGNISLAAEQLGVTRQTLYNKGKKYKLFE